MPIDNFFLDCLGMRHFYRKCQKGFGPIVNSICAAVTGKSFSDALILASTNPQLFIELRVQ